MRSGAQIISYELSVGMSIMTMVVLMGTMQFSEIVEGQANGWFIFKGHIPAVIAFIIYLIAGNAECNRGPFDLPEAESELTAGYHTEYSGMHFGFFLSSGISEFVYRSQCSRYYLLRRLDAAAYRWSGRIQRCNGLHPRLHLVLCQGILRCVPLNVDQMDFSTSAYRPDSESGMEISGSYFYGKPIVNGMLCRFRLPLLNGKTAQPGFHLE